MHIVKASVAALICAAALTLAANAAVTPPIAKCRAFGVSGNMVAKKIPGIDKPSNGLPNVAKGSKVYLACVGKPSTATSPDVPAQWWKSATFELFEKPGGSNAAFATIDTLRVSFVPDVEGTYRIRMIGTDNMDRTDDDTLVVNVAKYVGVGGIIGSAVPPECGVCHPAITTTWKATPHANALAPNLDDAAGHFQSFCLPCHTTGATDPAAEGDGFVHLMKTSAWKFPTALKAGNWDSLKLVAPELAKRAGVQCESCHGPGSAHNGVKTDNKIAINYASQQCNQCHDAPPHHLSVEEYGTSAHSNSMNEPGAPEYINRGSKTVWTSDCARCHTSNGYIDVFIKGGPDPTKAFTNAPYSNAAAVGCVTCHDPHDATNAHQLRKPIDVICADCHSVRVSSRGLHGSHQGPMLNGQDGREFPGYTYTNSAHTNIADKCAQCHMAAPPSQDLQNKLGGHTFRVVYDNGTPDVADDVVNNTGCVSCHTSGVTMSEIEEKQEEIKTLLNELKALLPLQANGNPKGPLDTTLTPLQKDCSYNWGFVNNDGSFGVHNFKYAKELLTSSIAELKKLDVEEVGGVPSSYALGQNYPNPFNPATTITFSVPQSGTVRLAVYDASGKEIALLANSTYTAGNYRVTWNAGTIPSGVYYYRLSAGSFNATRKMMLVK
ncbi:MAG: T9SS type A sorting domain-containing protein [Ignavibacteriae bacterium]|nr:T9SS type A sorting domain-containing protein [Ignavibacteriota bacterium]